MLKMMTFWMCFVGLAASATNPAGYWEGRFTVRGQAVNFAVTLEAGEPWSGTISIPVQGVSGLALADIQSKGSNVQFRITQIPGDPTFKGEISADGKEISGNLEQSGQAFPFSLTKKDKPSEAFARAGNFEIDPIAGEGPVGTWRGILKAGPATLHLELLVTQTADGALEAKLNSVDQNMVIPVDEVSLAEGTLKFKINRILANFSGELNKNQSAAEGKWRQAGQEAALTFFRVKN